MTRGRYAGPAASLAGLHTELFVKLPLPYRDDNEAFFLSCELHGDFPEVMFARMYSSMMTTAVHPPPRCTLEAPPRWPSCSSTSRPQT
jgi:hypothetical protein